VRQRAQRNKLRRLARRRRERAHAALERGQALLQHADGRVADPAVDVAGFLQAEEARAVRGRVEGEGGCGVDWDGARVGCGVGGVAWGDCWLEWGCGCGEGGGGRRTGVQLQRLEVLGEFLCHFEYISLSYSQSNRCLSLSKSLYVVVLEYLTLSQHVYVQLSQRHS
jgi:hypothetical protein